MGKSKQTDKWTLVSRCPYFEGTKTVNKVSCQEHPDGPLDGRVAFEKCLWQPCVCPMYVKAIKRDYPFKTKVRLIHMDGEPQMPKGLLGVVELVDDIGQIHVMWENGSSLSLTAYLDKFIKLK